MIKVLRNSFLLKNFKLTFLRRKYRIKNGSVIKYDKIQDYQNQAPPVLLERNFEDIKKPKVGIVKDGEYFTDYVAPNSSWLFYERYLRNSKIPYVIYDIFKDDWLEKSSDLDVIIWHTDSVPQEMYLAENKIYVLEKLLGKTCFPSFDEVWQYEDKNRANLLYRALQLPSIPTFASHSEKESLEYVSATKYPIISKVHIGAGSSGVKLIKNKSQAIKFVKRVFSYKGEKTNYSYMRQKDYVYFQEFIEDATFDLRIIIIGNKVFGYYRFPNKGDYRASGSGNYEKKELPLEAVKLAIDVKTKLNSRLMGVDLLYSNSRKKYYIIETSLFNRIDTPEQLVVDGIPGYYDIDDDLKFKKGKFWIHELVMDFVINQYLDKEKL